MLDLSRFRSLFRAAIIATVCFNPAFAQTPPERPGGSEFFEKSIRPLLADRCWECHSGSGKIKGGLRLDSRDAILRGGESGPSAVVGKPEESLLIDAVHYVDEPRMPPSGKLADSEIKALDRWIKEGLEWPESVVPDTGGSGAAVSTGFQITDEQRQFWSFQPVKEYVRPEVQDYSWPKSDIDAFILQALEAKGLKPAPLADRRALIRRATHDLTGLPPTVEEVEAFVNDIAPEAFAKVIDRLLASPRYGERWGRHWLDLVRYTDSFDARIAGSNNEMDVNSSYLYRDWVVNALNRDLPYDQFLTQQIAGDLVPGPAADGFNRDGIIATGMLAIGNWGGGDADKEKLLTDIADDQVDVVSRAFMGLTVACSRCHDHKFDPISTKDYYGLAGIFFSTHILPNVGPKTNGPPMLLIPLISESERLDREKRVKDLANLEARLKAEETKARQELTASLEPSLDRYVLSAWDYFQKLAPGQRPSLQDYATSQGLHEYAIRQWARELGFVSEDPLLRVEISGLLGNPGITGWRTPQDNPSVLINTSNDEIPILTFRLPAHTVSVHPGPVDSVAIAWKSPIEGNVAIQGDVIDADPSGGDGVAWALEIHSNGRRRTLNQGDLANGAAVKLEGGAIGQALASVAVLKGDLIELVISPKAEYTCDMTRIGMSLKSADGSKTWNLATDVSGATKAANPSPDPLGNPETWRFLEVSAASRSQNPILVDSSPIGKLRQLVADPSADRPSIETAAKVFQASGPARNESNPFWVRLAADEPALPEPARKTIDTLRAQIASNRADQPGPILMANGALEGGVPGSPHEGVHDVKVHIRGNYARLGDVVPRHFPVILAGENQPKVGAGSGRLELAGWLANPKHPLTARVMANRVWQHHLGSAIVKTPSNFGKLGERPTHPELLDFLATRLVRLGWSLKALHREIMLSSVYQQSAEADPATYQADPDNRLFGRMNRRRLDAESIRDGLLATSGTLDPRQGGPAIREMNQPRRSLYLMTIRSDRSSFGPLFDAADPTAIVDTRTVSTVAPQALFLLNNAFVIEQSKALAKRLATEVPGSDPDRIDRAYQILYSRRPSDDERRIGLETLSALMATPPKGTTRESAWESLCHVLYCGNEFVYLD